MFVLYSWNTCVLFLEMSTLNETCTFCCGWRVTLWFSLQSKSPFDCSKVIASWTLNVKRECLLLLYQQWISVEFMWVVQCTTYLYAWDDYFLMFFLPDLHFNLNDMNLFVNSVISSSLCYNQHPILSVQFNYYLIFSFLVPQQDTTTASEGVSRT